ncbi:MAG: TPM domain-containing protein [Oscillospiraceae bacterium]|nr:TPM domain-containing protein [Oscillospiraceae bacterium]
MPVFPIRWILMLALPVAIAAAVLAAASKRGSGVFKKQGVAWGLTVLMIFAAIGIGYAKAPFNGPVPEPGYPTQTAPPPASGSFVWDDANALSARTVRELDQRNDRLWDRHNITVAVVTCDNQRELGEYAYRQAEKMGLGGYDMVVALDIRGDNYWLLLGNDVGRDFPYDPSEYAYEYMENAFVRRDYDGAVLELTKALEDWYGKQYR